MEELILNNVKQWFIDRDLENGGRLDKQSLKLSEEFGELCAGFLKKIVTYLKSISNILGYEFLECFTGAYNEIKDRKGKWIDGSFIKKEDLKWYM